MNWIGVEEQLTKVIMERLYKSQLMADLNGNIFDCSQVDVNNNAYIYLGESEITEREIGNGMTETVIFTFHVYHRNDDAPETTTAYTKVLLNRLKYLLRQRPVLDHYECTYFTCDLSQVFSDIDLKTRHGVIRMKYVMRHKTI